MIIVKVRASIALALALVGIGAMSSVTGVPEKTKPPTKEKSPGLKDPSDKARAYGGGPTNHNPDGPACPGGPFYRKAWSEEAQVFGWRAQAAVLYYRARDGQIHAYTPGEDASRDNAFPGMARKLGLVLIPRKERRRMHREERARYKRIKARRSEGGVVYT